MNSKDVLKPWKELRSEYLLDTKWLRIFKKKYLLPNGHEIPDYYIAEKPNIVIVIPLDSKGRTILMQEFERGVQQVGFKFPAGRIEVGESPEQAAHREFLEETGITIGRLASVGQLHADPGWLTTQVHVFLAEGLEMGKSPERDGTELFEMEWYSFDAVGQKIKEGEIHNIFVVAAYQLASSYRSKI